MTYTLPPRPSMKSFSTETWIMGLVVIALVLVALLKLGGNGQADHPEWVQDLEDRGGRVMDVGTWNGHQDCIGVALPEGGGVVACPDGHRDQW